jgi:mediator of RNA polymerase II transcription subunit 14
MRMNLQEYDKTPLQFKNYTIRDGRVVFSVAGEFEIDLMIADEDPEKQFWFIDFRFLFSPTVRELPPHLRFHIEQRVNATLLSDSLTGCYKLLHEMVLTHKISEFRKQAFDLARGKWIEGLKVEVLNRALSVQYWVDRYGQKGPKSWIILGVHSGRRKDGRHDPKATSRLFLRWFRDGKEVKDVDIPFDTVNICTETLLKTVIGMHIKHILEATHEKLQARPLYAKGEMALSLNVSSDEPSHSELKVQLTSSQHLSVWISPITGRILFGPFMRINSQMESNINTKTQDPAKDAANFIEMLRCETAADEITNHGMSIGWMRIKKPYFKTDDLKSVFPKETVLVAWFQWPGWKKEWFFAASLSMSGERWWLIER